MVKKGKEKIPDRSFLTYVFFALGLLGLILGLYNLFFDKIMLGAIFIPGSLILLYTCYAKYYGKSSFFIPKQLTEKEIKELEKIPPKEYSFSFSIANIIGGLVAVITALVLIYFFFNGWNPMWKFNIQGSWCLDMNKQGYIEDEFERANHIDCMKNCEWKNEIWMLANRSWWECDENGESNKTCTQYVYDNQGENEKYSRLSDFSMHCTWPSGGFSGVPILFYFGFLAIGVAILYGEYWNWKDYRNWRAKRNG